MNQIKLNVNKCIEILYNCLSFQVISEIIAKLIKVHWDSTLPCLVLL